MSDLINVLRFWEEAGPDKWYAKDDAFDEAIRARFLTLWEDVEAGRAKPEPGNAREALGLVILLDQFPRNMFREDPRAFATDARAMDVSGRMIANGWDREIEGPLRQFVYMPFMHAEELAHQDICVDLMATRMEEGNNALHARVHREIIARFGRFPYRNAALGRETTPEERAFLEGGGYGAILKELESEDG
jgi:uncharacterized protein (DUF924 family)